MIDIKSNFMSLFSGGGGEETYQQIRVSCDALGVLKRRLMVSRSTVRKLQHQVKYVILHKMPVNASALWFVPWQ